MNNDLIKSVASRFVRGALAGAVGNMIILGVFSGTSFYDLKVWLFMLAISGTAGAVSGGILALDKYLRYDQP